MLTLEFKNMHASSYAMPTNENRYYLNGLYIEITDEKVNYVGTTGSMLIKTTQLLDEKVAMKSFIMPHTIVNAVIKQVKALKKDFKCLELSKDGKIYSLSICSHSGLDSVLNFEAIDGTFPDYRRTLPPVDSKNALHTIGFSSVLMADIGKAIEIFSEAKSKNKCTHVYFGADASSVITIGKDIENFHAVLMPMR